MYVFESYQYLVQYNIVLMVAVCDQLDPEARGLPGSTHGWLLTQSNTNDPTNWFFRVWETGL